MIKDYFVGLTDHFAPLRQGATPVSVPHEYLVSETEVLRSLSSLKISKAVGPDDIPNKILKEPAPELAPIIRDIYNQSLREGYTSSISAQVLHRYPCSQGVPAWCRRERSKTDIPHLHISKGHGGL